MEATELLDNMEAIEEYRDLIVGFINTYGADLESIMTRAGISMARIQRATYSEFIDQGFSREEAMKLLLNAKFSIIDSLNKGK